MLDLKQSKPGQTAGRGMLLDRSGTQHAGVLLFPPTRLDSRHSSPIIQLDAAPPFGARGGRHSRECPNPNPGAGSEQLADRRVVRG